jgi:hypothetical protein
MKKIKGRQLGLEWPRFSPIQQVMLCDNCWNGKHWSGSFIDGNSVKQPRRNTCQEGGCGCGCCHDLAPRKPTFTGEGQMKIDVPAIVITPTS